MKEEYSGFGPFYDNNLLKPVLEYVYENSNDLITLMNNIPFYANIDEETGSIFDGEMLSHLSYFYYVL